MAMKRGDRGQGVVALQQALNRWIDRVHERVEGDDRNLQRLVTDGSYGAQTAYVVTLVQNNLAGVSSTGDACDDTLGALGIEPGTGPNDIQVVDSSGGGI